MRRLTLALAVLLWMPPLAVADEPTVLESPSNAFERFKKAVGVLDPQVEWIFDLKDGDWETGYSAALWHIKSNQFNLASVRAGYAVSETVYGGIKLDLPGITNRYLPEFVKSTPVLDKLLEVSNKYAAVGVVAGYDSQENEPMYGFSVGGSVKF